MLSLMTLAIILFILSNIVSLLAIILSKKSIYEREKNSPFECGFDPISPPRLPFSLKFFMLTILFLIFDVEIALFLPSIIMMIKSNMYLWNIISMTFLTILILGLFHEWNQQTLEWSN